MSRVGMDHMKLDELHGDVDLFEAWGFSIILIFRVSQRCALRCVNFASHPCLVGLFLLTAQSHSVSL